MSYKIKAKDGRWKLYKKFLFWETSKFKDEVTKKLYEIDFPSLLSAKEYVDKISKKKNEKKHGGNVIGEMVPRSK